MTYQGGGGAFYTQPVQEPSDDDFEDYPNDEYNVNEVMEDGGDQFADDQDQYMQGEAVASRSDSDKYSAEHVPISRKSRRQQRALDSEDEVV